MQVRAKARKPIIAKPSRVYVDYERIISEAILAIPEPIPGEKGEQGIKGDTIKGVKGDSVTGLRGHKGDKGESVQGAKGEYGKKGTQGDKGLQGNRGKEGLKGKESVIDYERIFSTIGRELSKDRTLSDFSIKKQGGGTLVITKLYKDGRKTTDKITLQTGGGTGGAVGGVTQLTSTDASVTLSPVGGTGIVDLSVSTSGTGLMPYRVRPGDTLEIPADFAVIGCGTFELDGQINLNGRMCI